MFNLAVFMRLINYKYYMHLLVLAHKSMGVSFIGRPEYIDNHAKIDPSGGVILGNNIVISTNVIILTHDYSFIRKMIAKNQKFTEDMHYLAFKPVEIGDDTFIGAGAIILPGSKVGKCCIIGAGAVVKGDFDDYSIIVGTPARRIKDIRE